jgi:predicted acyltransferase (DUF342 family)
MEVLLVSSNDFDFHPSLTQNTNAVMLSQAALIPHGRVVDADIYASELLTVGERSALRAALGRADVILRKNSAVLRWLHADGSIYLRRGSASYGRLSSSRAIYLEPECSFERMYAPRIIVLDPDLENPDLDNTDLGNAHLDNSVQESRLPATRGASESPAATNIDMDDIFRSSRRRLLVSGDFVLPAGETLYANVIATRDVRIGAGSRLFGSSKSYRDTVVEQGASVYGSIVCGGTMHLTAHAFVAGPVMAEGDVRIGQGSRVGAPDALTTVSSNGAQLSPGCQLHGTVWTRARGTVEG